MKDVGKRQFVQRRGGMLHFRRKYPPEVVGKLYEGDKLGREFKRSLGTGDYKKIEPAYEAAISEFNGIVDAVRNGAVRVKKARTLQQLHAAVGEAKQFREQVFDVVRPWFLSEWGVAPALTDQDDVDEIAREFEAEAAACRDLNDGHMTAIFREAAKIQLERHGFELEENDLLVRAVADLMARAKAHKLNLDAALVREKSPPRIFDPEILRLLNGAGENIAARRTGRRTFGDLVASYSKDRAQENRSEKTRLTDELLARTMLEAFGAKTELHDIDVEKCRSFRALIVKLPANFTKLYPETALSQIPALAERDGRAPMSSKNALKYIARLKAVFAHGIDVERWMDHNPAKSIKIKPEARGLRKYATFTHDELKQLFTAPIFTGCKDAKGGAQQPGKVIPNDTSRFWVPLIGLYTGMRQGEICQLHVADIRQKEGVWVISVTDIDLSNESEPSGKSVKTEGSKRDLPINQELVRLGLLDFAQQRRSAGAKYLFVEQEAPKHADSFQKWFKRLRKARGLTRKGLVFHSLRHTLRQALRVARTDIEVARKIGGWAGPKDQSLEYGEGPIAEAIIEAISKVNFQGVTDHIKPFQSRPGKR